MRLLPFWYDMHTAIRIYVCLVVTFALDLPCYILDLWCYTSTITYLTWKPLCKILLTLHQTVIR